jgi:hypothetical protein
MVLASQEPRWTRGRRPGSSSSWTRRPSSAPSRWRWGRATSSVQPGIPSSTRYSSDLATVLSGTDVLVSKGISSVLSSVVDPNPPWIHLILVGRIQIQGRAKFVQLRGPRDKKNSCLLEKKSNKTCRTFFFCKKERRKEGSTYTA